MSAPSQPTGVTAIVTGYNTIRVSWNKIANWGTGFSKIRVEVFYFNDVFTFGENNTNKDLTTMDIPGDKLYLDAEFNYVDVYSVVVTAVGKGGNAISASYKLLFQFTPPSLTAVSNVIKVWGPGTVYVSWPTVTEFGSGRFGSYTVSTVCTANGSINTCVDVPDIEITNPTVNNCLVKGLKNGNSYRFLLTITNSVGIFKSITLGSIGPFVDPLAITSLTKGQTYSSMLVSWNALPNIYPSSKYTITATPRESGVTPITATSSTTSVLLNPLTPGASYIISVSAKNYNNVNVIQDGSNYRAGDPLPRVSGFAVDTSNTSPGYITLKWNTVKTALSPPIIGYLITAVNAFKDDKICPEQSTTVFHDPNTTTMSAKLVKQACNVGSPVAYFISAVSNITTTQKFYGPTTEIISTYSNMNAVPQKRLLRFRK